jgi:hypothetical protein
MGTVLKQTLMYFLKSCICYVISVIVIYIVSYFENKNNDNFFYMNPYILVGIISFSYFITLILTIIWFKQAKILVQCHILKKLYTVFSGYDKETDADSLRGNCLSFNEISFYCLLN